MDWVRYEWLGDFTFWMMRPLLIPVLILKFNSQCLDGEDQDCREGLKAFNTLLS